jgi:hypothetical protein
MSCRFLGWSGREFVSSPFYIDRMKGYELLVLSKAAWCFLFGSISTFVDSEL